MARANILKNKTVIKMFLAITLPIALQNVLNYAVGFMDMVMVGALGEEQLSAVSVANQPFFLFMLCIFGLSSGAGVMISQYWGKKDIDTISRIFGITIKAAMIVGIAVTALIFIFPEQIMRIYTNEEAIVPYGVSYLKVVGFAYVLSAFNMAYINCVRNIERVKIAMVTYGVSFFVNVFFNYMFIFGKLGAPEMGVAGAAVGTVIARIAEFVILVFYATKIETRVKLRMSYILKNDRSLVRDYAKIALPVVVNEMMWSFAMSAQMMIVGRMGVSALAAISVTSNVAQIMMSVTYGAASATLVITGKYIGAKDYQGARGNAWGLVLLNVMIAAISAVGLLLLRPAFISLYSLTDSFSDATKAAIYQTLLVSAAIMIFQAVNVSCIVGVFRGGGDTVFAMWLDVIATWAISVPLGALGGLVFGLSIPLTFMLLRSDEVIKAVVCMARLRGGKWLKNVTRDESGHMIGEVDKLGA